MEFIDFFFTFIQISSTMFIQRWKNIDTFLI